MSTRLFISYAHRDGGGLAARLLSDLQTLGFDVWLDRLRLKGGDLWTNEIEDALDRAQVVLALLSAGSFTSDTCRAEQGWSLDTGKCVIPLRVPSDCRVPIPLPPPPMDRLQRPSELRRIPRPASRQHRQAPWRSRPVRQPAPLQQCPAPPRHLRRPRRN